MHPKSLFTRISLREPTATDSSVLTIRPDLLQAQQNLLLRSLDPSDLALLAPHLTPVEMGGGECLLAIGAPEPVACFPLTLVASVVEVMADGSRFEIGLIGPEGVIGWPIALCGPHVAPAGIVQLGGGAMLTVPLSVLPELCAQSRPLHAAMLAFAQSFAVQMSHMIVANLRDGIERRLARWLLMLHDRVPGDVLVVTHGELASALHVRRASITDTLHVLEGNRIVRCSRGQLAVRDRAALVAAAGDSYGPPEASYRALIGAFGKG
jgi:CRP-like cAMP-binding protein